MRELHLTPVAATNQYQRLFLECVDKRNSAKAQVFRISCDFDGRPWTLVTTSKDMCLKLVSLGPTGRAMLCMLLDEVFEGGEEGDNELMLSTLSGGDTPSTKHSEVMHVVRTYGPGQGLLYSVTPIR